MKSAGIIGTTIIVAAVGLVAYKILHRRRHSLAEKFSRLATDITDIVSEIADDVATTLQEGYEAVTAKQDHINHKRT